MTAAMSIPGLIDPVPVPRPMAAGADPRVDLIGLSKAEIRAALIEADLDERQAKLRAKQLWHQIYNRGARDFSAMSDIAKPQRLWFDARFRIGRPDVVVEQVSTDGTRKWLLKTPDGHDFEMVFIPDADRGTLCVSSQVGCTLNCTFCFTGTMRLVRNLTAGEIVGQVMLARDALGEWPSLVRSSHLRVPSVETCSITTSGRAISNRSPSHRRCGLAMSLIAEKSRAPRL